MNEQVEPEFYVLLTFALAVVTENLLHLLQKFNFFG